MPLIYQALLQMSSLTTTATSAACADSSNLFDFIPPSFGRSLETRQPVSEEGEAQQKHLLREKAGSNYLCVA